MYYSVHGCARNDGVRPSMNKIIVIGHKNPDTDSVISAIAAEELFAKCFEKDAKAFRAGQINNETKFILEKIGVEVPELISDIDIGQAVALVDHNELGQVSEKVSYANVEYILDHHKLSIATEKPIFCRVEPIGSTSSLVAKMLFEKTESVSEKNAKLLLAGILSDTLNFKSPTTTEEDKKLVEKLNLIAKIDLEKFVEEMFLAKSSLEGILIEEIITLDYKVFEMGSKKVGIGTWETTNPESVNEKKAEILKALIDQKDADKLDFIYFMVVDIFKQNCSLYLIGKQEEEIAKIVFGGQVENEMMFLPGVVSRKKQIVPPLTEELNK